MKGISTNDSKRMHGILPRQDTNSILRPGFRHESEKPCSINPVRSHRAHAPRDNTHQTKYILLYIRRIRQCATRFRKCTRPGFIARVYVSRASSSAHPHPVCGRVPPGISAINLRSSGAWQPEDGSLSAAAHACAPHACVHVYPNATLTAGR